MLLFGKKFDITDELAKYETLHMALCDMRIQWHINHKGGGISTVFKFFSENSYNTDLEKILKSFGFLKETDRITELERELYNLRKENEELKKNQVPRLKCLDEWH